MRRLIFKQALNTCMCPGLAYLTAPASLRILDRPGLCLVFHFGVFIFFPLGYKSSIIPQGQGPSQRPTHAPLCRGELSLCIASEVSIFSHLEALLHRGARRIFPQNIPSQVILSRAYLFSSSTLQNLSPHLFPIFEYPGPKCQLNWKLEA